MIKLSFTGDVSLDKPLLKASKKTDGKYRFDTLFRDIEPVFAGSDMIIGNLETVFGGEDKGYNVKPFGYNSPDEYLLALKDFGFDLFSVANNHCLDEGVGGLRRTVDICHSNGIDTVGTVDAPNYLVRTVNGVRIAFVSYTQMINRSPESDRITGIGSHVNLLYPYRSVQTTGIRKLINSMPLKYREGVKRMIGIPTVTKITDSLQPGMLNDDFTQRLKKNIAEAKANADVVVMLVHCGGQFNDAPGEYVNKLFDIISGAGADVIIGNHPHVIHRIDSSEKCIKAFSLGGFTLSPSAEYVHPDAMADHSMIVHLYLDETTKSIAGAAFSFVHGTEDRDHNLSLKPIRFNDDESEIVRRLFNRVVGRNEEDALKISENGYEYEFYTSD